MQGGFMSFVLLVVLVYMIFRTATLGMRTKKNQDMIKILNQMDEPEEFYKEADAYIEANKDPEFTQKVAVLRLFADAAYDHDDLFLKHLEELEINQLLDIGKKKKDGFSQNEDSFYLERLCDGLAARFFLMSAFFLAEAEPWLPVT